MSAIVNKIRKDVIGEGRRILTPFGERPLVYADYTASGRGLAFIESFVTDKVLPFYANTHSESSLTGRQSTLLREQARAAIKSSVNASKDHKVIFCGAGATAAITKLIGLLELDKKRVQEPVIFIGPYEHHSNELPWRELPVQLEVIPLNEQGLICQRALKAALERHKNNPLKLGSFSAGSNVTGVLTDVKSISALLHEYGALSCWDYAAAAPYVAIDVSNSLKSGDNSLDAVYISTHKFIGGPGTPGVLVVNQNIVQNEIPVIPGGGTVSFVAPERHRYIDCIERREEGGTPAIVESIRAGLVFKLKDQVGAEHIESLESEHLAKAFKVWSNNANIDILGGTQNKRLSIVSLRFRSDDKELHYGFAVALLNDLFGIQVRGGCSCAGPYGHHLLNLDDSKSVAIERANLAGDMVLRPGWIRLNFNYFLDSNTVDYLVRAVDWVATHGRRFLPFYEFDACSGTWNYEGKRVALSVSLDDVFADSALDTGAFESIEYVTFLNEAQKLLAQHCELKAQPKDVDLVSDCGALRWFVQPTEA